MCNFQRIRPTPILLAISALVSTAGVAARPIPCSQTIPPPAASPAQQLRRHIGIGLTADTTMAQVVAALGPAYSFGPGREMISYRFEGDDNSQLWLWLSFEPAEPRRLTRALLQYLDRPYCMTWDSTTLLNNLEITKIRRRDQLDYSRRLSAADVYAVWGPPDGESGSGFQFWHYTLANGETAVLVFDDGYVLGSGGRRRRPR